MLTKRIAFVQVALFVLFISFGLSVQADTNTVVNGVGKSLPVVQDNLYHPEILYKGDYIPMKLYYRERKSQPWKEANTKADYRDAVTCSKALAKLSMDGRWAGNLNQDGSCGTTAEPSSFVLGNWLNYEDSLNAE